MQPNAHSTLMDGISQRSNKHNLPTTRKMLEEAILTLNCHCGFSLYRLKKYICEKYQINLTTQRQNIIRNQLRKQLADGMLINVTGKGLSGHIRVETKKKKRNTSSTIATDAASNAIKRKKVVGKSKSAVSRSVPQDTNRTPPNVAVQPLMPRAPHRNSMADHTHLEAGETPCTSGGRVGRKRKLLPPPEDIVISQEY